MAATISCPGTSPSTGWRPRRQQPRRRGGIMQRQTFMPHALSLQPTAMEREQLKQSSSQREAVMWRAWRVGA